MCEPGTVLLKRQVRHSKTEPIVDEVELLQANPQYAHIRYLDGRETTISTRHLAPAGKVATDEGESCEHSTVQETELDGACHEGTSSDHADVGGRDQNMAPIDNISVRLFGRVSRPPVRLDL